MPTGQGSTTPFHDWVKSPQTTAKDTLPANAASSGNCGATKFTTVTASPSAAHHCSGSPSFRPAPPLPVSIYIARTRNFAQQVYWLIFTSMIVAFFLTGRGPRFHNSDSNNNINNTASFTAWMLSSTPLPANGIPVHVIAFRYFPCHCVLCTTHILTHRKATANNNITACKYQN